MTLRIKFKKYGSLVYLGHLDVMRYFQKAIRRSGIDASYTEGYSPHLKLSFAQPLSVGVETDGDYFDLVINSLPDMNQIKKLMNEQCVDGFEIVSVTLLDDDADNAMSSVKAADYRYTFDSDLDEDVLNAFFSQESYVFEYIQKDKPKVRDLIEDIYDFEIIDNLNIRVRVNCSSSGNLKANVIFEALKKFGLKQNCLYFKRLDLFTLKDDKYVTLAEMGEIYD